LAAIIPEGDEIIQPSVDATWERLRWGGIRKRRATLKELYLFNPGRSANAIIH
jgi:hypothetical protein